MNKKENNYNDTNNVVMDLKKEPESDNRYGRLLIKESFYTQDNIEKNAKIFEKFMPTRIEFLFHLKMFEMFGWSKFFDDLDLNNEPVPIYDCYVENDEATFERRED